MTILHILPSLDPHGGGPIRSVVGLCRGLSKNGVDTVLFVHSPVYPLSEPAGIRFITGRGTYLGYVVCDAIRVLDEVKPDIIHLHGVWTFSNHIWVCLAQKRKIPYIIAPRGMLEPWSLNAKKWKKRFAMWLYQRRDLAAAVALHATAESEAKQFRQLRFKQPIVVLPNGVDFPCCMSPRTRMDERSKRTVLFLSRIHPKKGLLELIDIWAKMKGTDQRQKLEREQSSFPVHELSRWHVEYAGPNCGGHLSIVQKRIKAVGVEDDFTYLGDLDDLEKWIAYRNSDLFVLPTYSENFGIVVAEALTARVPVITTKGTPWAELVSEHCGWWIDIGAEPLADALREALSLTDEERCVMGENGRRLVEARYAWPVIAKQMVSAYKWVLHDGERPTCVLS